MTAIENKIIPALFADIQQRLQADGIQKTVVGAVILQRGQQLLLVERAADDFMGGLVELPSGTVDAGEGLIEALVREVKEETSLEVVSVDAYVGCFDYVSGSGKKARQLNFLVTVADGEVRLNPQEHTRFHSLSPTSAELTGLNISAETRQIIAQALSSR